MRLANKVAVITGGGTGIGQATAYIFAREGAKVVVAQRTDAEGEETAATIKSRGGDAIFVHADVTKASEVEHLIKVAVDTFGKLDILFNNAGLTQASIMVENIDESLWDQIYAVNVKGVFLGAKYAVPEMKKAGGGVIINTGSIAGIRPRLGTSAYSSTKGAVIVLTKALALELAPYNIRVNCINLVSTDTARKIVRFRARGIDMEEHEKSVVSGIPIGRLAIPEDTAYAALYLASDESSMVTGISINVDGGYGI